MFLLEINFTELSRYHTETQKYWTLAVYAALVAQNCEQARGARAKRIWCQINAKIPSRQKLGMVAIEQQIRKDGMHQSPIQNSSNEGTSHTQTSMESFTRKQPHPSAVLGLLKLNKRMRKRTDPRTSEEPIVSEATHLACYWLFKRTFLPRIWDQRGRVPTGVPNPAALCNLAVVRHVNQKDFCLSQLYIVLVVIY